jgi:siderophore synthetase component
MTREPPVPEDTLDRPVPQDSSLRPTRDRATFLAWTAAALPRVFVGALAPAPTGPPWAREPEQPPLAASLPPAVLAAAWALAGRDIAARLALACAREQLVDAVTTAGAVTLRPAHGPPLLVPLARPGAFDLHRPDLDADRDPALEHPLALLHRLAADLSLGTATHARIADELADSAFNLALALALAELRARTRLAGRRWPAPLDPENLVVAGHPWHPMTRTRLGLHLHDNLRHAPEALALGTLCAVDIAAADAVVTGSFAELSARIFPVAAPGWVRVPVHALQRRRLPRLFGPAWGARVRPAACVPRAGRSLLSLRTVALGDLHIKLATDMHTTSARRQVSPMSVRNGPVVGDLLAKILAGDPHARRGLRVQLEPAAAGLDPAAFGAHAGQLGVLLRDSPAPLARSLADTCAPVSSDTPSIWVCAALGERWPGDPHGMSQKPAPSLARDPGLLHRRTGDLLLRTISSAYPDPDAALRRYVDLLVPPALRLCTAHGVALELHLQNTLVVHQRGHLCGFIVRDLGGIRLHRDRLRAAGHSLTLAPGSFLATDDVAEVQTKLAHTLFHAHLTAVFAWAHDLGADPSAAWDYTHSVVRNALSAWSADPRLAPACAADQSALLAKTTRAKSLLRMRLDERTSDYAYTTVTTPFN